MIIRVFKFKHPKTLEIFSEIRDIKEADSPFIAPDGIVCEPYGIQRTDCKKGIVVKGKEVFEKYPNDVHDLNPKKIRYKDGHREKYDPTRHC